MILNANVLITPFCHHVQDDRLREAVKLHEGRNWAQVAAMVAAMVGSSGAVTAKKCKLRWNDTLQHVDKGMLIQSVWSEDSVNIFCLCLAFFCK